VKFQPGETNIICTNLKASLTFYRDILGFSPTLDDDGFYHLQASGQQFLLLPNATEKFPDAKYESIAHMSMDLYVKNLEKAYHYFKDHNVPFAQKWQSGAVMFVIRDPDGLHWEILE